MKRIIMLTMVLVMILASLGGCYWGPGGPGHGGGYDHRGSGGPGGGPGGGAHEELH